MNAKFNLTPAQQCALVVIEVQQQALVFATNMLAHQNINEQAAAEMLKAQCVALDAAKMKWLESTQRAVQVASVIPDKMRLVQP